MPLLSKIQCAATVLEFNGNENRVPKVEKKCIYYSKSVKLTMCFIFEIYLSATQKTFLIRKQNKIQYRCLDGSYSYVYVDASTCPEGAE